MPFLLCLGVGEIEGTADGDWPSPPPLTPEGERDALLPLSPGAWFAEFADESRVESWGGTGVPDRLRRAAFPKEVGDVAECAEVAEDGRDAVGSATPEGAAEARGRRCAPALPLEGRPPPSHAAGPLSSLAAEAMVSRMTGRWVVEVAPTAWSPPPPPPGTPREVEKGSERRTREEEVGRTNTAEEVMGETEMRTASPTPVSSWGSTTDDSFWSRTKPTRLADRRSLLTALAVTALSTTELFPSVLRFI